MVRYTLYQLGPKWSKKKTLHRHVPKTLLTKFWNFRGLLDPEVKLSHTWSYLGQNMALAWSKHEIDIVQKSNHFIIMFHRPWWLSLNNFRALSVLDMKLGHTWPSLGPDMAPNGWDSIYIYFGPCWLINENCKDPAGQDSMPDKLWCQHDPNISLTWFQKVYCQ